jgi:phosphatidylinositol alpha-1,6-mannosyltransferase
VDGRSVPAVADRVAGLLADPDSARAMGEKGRAWVERDWRWDVLAGRLGSLLHG